jgi:hypothetical protein
MACGHMNRVKRPDTLHRPMLQNVKKVLANPEPSTHDPRAELAAEPPVLLDGLQAQPLRRRVCTYRQGELKRGTVG